MLPREIRANILRGDAECRRDLAPQAWAGGDLMKARRTAWAGVTSLAAGVVLAAAMVGFARPAVLAGRSNREVADRMLQQRQRSRAGKAPRRNVPGAPSRSPAPAAGPGLASRVRAIEANAAAPQTEAAPSPLFHPGKHATGMTAQEAAEGTDQVFHDFSARDSSSARAGQASLAREEAKMAAELQTVRGRQQVPRGRGRALDTEEKKMAAEAHIYDADANIKVVDGTGGDDVASGIGAGVGDTWVTARKARIAADAPVPTAPPGANGVPRARRVKNVAASALPPRRGGLQHPRFFNNDVNVKVVAGTEGDGVASGLGASVGEHTLNRASACLPACLRTPARED